MEKALSIERIAQPLLLRNIFKGKLSQKTLLSKINNYILLTILYSTSPRTLSPGINILLSTFY